MTVRPSGHWDKRANLLDNGQSTMISPIITLVVGPDLRLFAAYEHALLKSPYFAKRLRDQFYETSSNRLKLPDMYANNSISHTIQSCRRTDIHTGCLRFSPVYSSTYTRTTIIPAYVKASVTTPGSSRTRTRKVLVAADACHPQYIILGWTATTCLPIPLCIALPKISAWRN